MRAPSASEESALTQRGSLPSLRHHEPLCRYCLSVFSWFLGARQRTGMSDCHENDSPPQREEGQGVVGGIVSERQPPLTPPYQGGESFS